jgi:hypothetical protein
MTTTRTTIDQLMRKAKGKARQVTGRPAADRRTRVREWMVRIGGDAWLAGRRLSQRFSRTLRNVAHR